MEMEIDSKVGSPSSRMTGTPVPPGSTSKPRSRGSVSRPSKAVFTSSLNYPEAVPTPLFAQVEDGELNRSQRRSKVEAISRIDKVGTPIPLTAGPTATSFLPAARQSSAGPSAPGPSRNPLHRVPPSNPAFNVDSVRQKAPRHPPSRSRSRLFGLEECPIFYPTKEQFADPMGYIESISSSARPYGLCKIVPPEGWKMPFALNPETFNFRTRTQRLNSLEAASRAKVNFHEQLSMFHLQRDDTKVSIPSINRKPVDLWLLRKEVNKMGGPDEVTRIQGWPVVAKKLGYDQFFATELKSAYLSIIQPFDHFAIRARSMSASPLSPMPSTKRAKPPGFAVESPGSPTRPKSRMSGMSGPSSNSGASSSSGSNLAPLKRESPPLRSVMSEPAIKRSSPLRTSPRSSSRSGPTAPTSSAPSVTSVSFVPPPLEEVPMLLRRSGPFARPPAPLSFGGGPTPVSAPPSLPPARIKVPGFAGSRDGSESELSEDEAADGLRKDHLPEYQKGEVCEICRRGDGADKILLCDGCDRGFHTFCLDPPLAAVPTNEEWFCTPCVLSQGESYGFGDGETHSLASFQARDAGFSTAWFNQRWRGPVQRTTPPSSPTVSDSGLTRRFGRAVVTEDDVEREFWRLTESPIDTVEVEYGADIHSTTHGSASPTTETRPLEVYSRDGWNLNNMPIAPDSLLRYIKSDISGMTIPWIYVGMLFSTFCWHNEDHYTYSVNYMHWGETKTWYGIPGHDAGKFEDAMRSEAPELFEQQPALLYQLVTMMNPGRLKEAGVDVFACDQRPNEFVITFPKAFHCGFNHGINLNEAVNFALPDWLPDGRESVVKYKQYAKPPVFSHNEMLITVCLFSETIKTALWLQHHLRQMVIEETAKRERLRAAVPLLTEVLDEEDTPEELYQCCICKGFCYLSQVTCKCTKAVACPDHAEQLCSCSSSKRTLRKRYSEAQLEELLGGVEARAALPSTWRAKFDALLESPRPALKSMRALLADGEKIQYPMSEISDLRSLVDRANIWTERAIAVTTRKGAARRRKGRQDTEDEDSRTADTVEKLLRDAERLAFDTPEIMELKQIMFSIQNFQSEARSILETPEAELDIERCRTSLILGNSLNIDLREVQQLQTLVNRLEWFHKVDEEVDDRALQYPDVVELLDEANEYEIPPDHPTIIELRLREEKGRQWKDRTEALMSAKSIELDDITALIEGQELTPTVLELMLQLESMRTKALQWQTTARQQLEGQGSFTSAQRLCKNVSSAAGPLGRIRIPEITKIQGELDFHAQWVRGVCDVLQVKQIRDFASTLDSVVVAMRQHLQEDDEKPNEQRSCFCRTAPLAVMVKCSVCRGSYHPKCVGVAIKNVNNPFRCAMCDGQPTDTRPSLHALCAFEDTHHWNFLFPPVEIEMVKEVADIAVRFARLVIPLLDPANVAEIARGPELFTHWARKLYNLPISFDVYDAQTNSRAVFEDWLYKRIHDSRNPAKAKTRPRKPKLVLKESRDGQFACVCQNPPPDALVTIMCQKCGQGYHATCVFAPAESLGPLGKPWRCPCCTVREGKHYLRGAEVRVQTTDRLGTDTFVDYRTTINGFATSILEYPLPPKQDHCIVLECTQFVPPVIPEGFEPPKILERDEADPAIAENGEPQKKRRRVKAAVSKLDVPVSTADGPTSGNAPTPVTLNGLQTTLTSEGPARPPAPSGSLLTQTPIVGPAPGTPRIGSIPQQPTTPRTILDVQPHRSDTHPFGTTSPRSSMFSNPFARPNPMAMPATPSVSRIPPMPTGPKPLLTTAESPSLPAPVTELARPISAVDSIADGPSALRVGSGEGGFRDLTVQVQDSGDTSEARSGVEESSGDAMPTHPRERGVVPPLEAFAPFE